MRVSIDREIDIVKKLKPGTDEAVLLNKHIGQSIRDLIERDNARSQAAKLAGWFGLMAVLFAVFYGSVALRQSDQLAGSWKLAVQFFGWLSYVAFITALILALFDSRKLYVNQSVQSSKWSIVAMRLGRAALRRLGLRRASAKLKGRLERHLDQIENDPAPDMDNYIRKNGVGAWIELSRLQAEVDDEVLETRVRLAQEGPLPPSRLRRR